MLAAEMADRHYSASRLGAHYFRNAGLYYTDIAFDFVPEHTASIEAAAAMAAWNSDVLLAVAVEEEAEGGTLETLPQILTH